MRLVLVLQIEHGCVWQEWHFVLHKWYFSNVAGMRYSCVVGTTFVCLLRVLCSMVLCCRFDTLISCGDNVDTIFLNGIYLCRRFGSWWTRWDRVEPIVVADVWALRGAVILWRWWGPRKTQRSCITDVKERDQTMKKTHLAYLYYLYL